MRRRCPLIGLVVGVHVLAALIPTVICPLWAFHNVLGQIYAALNFGQGSLLGIWVVLGGRPHPWRFVGVVVVSAASITLVEMGTGALQIVMGTGGLEIVMWVSLVLQQTIATSLPLLVIRLVGVELVQASWDSSTTGPQRLQFSLGSLFAWTAAMAVLMSALHYLPTRYFPDIFTWQLAEFLGLHALVALVAIWVGLSTRWLVLRMIVLALGIGLVVAIDHLCWSRGAQVRTPIFWTSEAFFLLGSFWLIRVAGYRLLWRRGVRL